MKYLFLCVVLFLVGCGTSTTEQRTFELEYTKDPRTGLCFASRGWGYDFGTMSNVPCTPEVERLINPFVYSSKPNPTATPIDKNRNSV